MTLKDFLQSVYDEHTELRSRLVLDTIRDESHPFHGMVEWDDSIGGEDWRLHQIRKKIRTVTIAYRPQKDGGQEKIRAWHSVRDDSGYHFEPIEKVVADDITYKIVMKDMAREWKQLRDRYDKFVEFRKMVMEDVA